MPKQRARSERYLETRCRANGVIAFYYCPPRAAVKAGVVQRAPLGTDVATAVEKARRYNEVLDDWRRGEQVERDAPAHGSIDWGIRRFRQVRNRPNKKRKKRLSKKTQRDYDYYLDRLAEIRLKDGRRLGDLPMKALEPSHAQRIYEIFGKMDKNGDIQCHRAGLYAVQVCRRLWKLVGRIELKIALNPFAELELGGVEAREVEWSYDQVMNYVEAARQKNLLSVAAVALLCYDLVQRPVDMLALTWRQLDAGTLRQSKGGQRAYFLHSPELTELLDALKRLNKVEFPRDLDQPIVLYEGTGHRYDERHFRIKAAEVRKAAGLNDNLKIGDLRRSGATALTEAGATDSEARSVTGHASIDVFRRHYDVEKAEKAAKAHDKRMAAREILRAARAERKAAEAGETGAHQEEPDVPASPEEEPSDAAA